MGLITVNPTLDMLSDQQPSIYYLDDGTAVFKCISAPEGVIEANAGSLALQSNGAAWIKSTIGGNTGWVTVGNTTRFGSNISPVSTSGTGLDSLQSLNYPANLCAAAGEGFRIYASGQANGNAGNHRWVLNFSGGPILDTTLVAVGDPAAADWISEVEAIFVSASSIQITTRLWVYSAAQAQIGSFGNLVNTGGGFPPSGTYTFQYAAECANGADNISCNVMIGSKI